jgi:hypothetical protein
MGHRVRRLLAILCVAYSSIALVALGGSDTTRWGLPSNPELWQTPRQSWDPFWIWLPYPMMYRARHTRSRMTHKIIFTVPFYHTRGAQPLCLHDVYNSYTAVHPTSSHTISHRLPASFPMIENKEEIEKQI